MGRTQRSDRGKMMEKLTLSQRREERSAAKPQPKRIKDGGSKRRSCSLANVRSEEKRQRTAALQNLVEASWLRGARSRLGVRLSSAAFARTAQRRPNVAISSSVHGRIALRD